jgi:hypothetical protein
MLVSWRARFTVAQKPTLVIGVGAYRGLLHARRGAKSIHWVIRDAKKDAKIAS